MERRETMRARQEPDVYDGPECDEHRSQWNGSSALDKDGSGIIGDMLELRAETFPPGTQVIVREPVCPDCGSVPQGIFHDNELKPLDRPKWECECDFDWHEWAAKEFG